MIKEFESVKEAYDGFCCVCNTSYHSLLSEANNWKGLPNIINIILPDKDKISFDIDSGYIIDFPISKKSISNNVVVLGFANSSDLTKLPKIEYSIYNGLFIVGHKINCNCMMYDRTLQLFVDTNIRKVFKAVLNSEFVTYEVGDAVYEIKNIYSTGKTEYTRILPYEDTETLILPLVSDNLRNPGEIVSRIEKLLIFS